MGMDPWAWMTAHVSWHEIGATLAAHATWDEVPGYIGAGFVIASLMMRLMIPLRALTLLSNLCFIVYALLHGQFPTLLLHVVLVPLNAVRIWQMMRLIRRVRAAAQGDHTMASLKPYMKRRKCRAGEVLFRKGEPAHDLHYIVAGSFRVTEIGLTLPPGQFVGELGLLAPSGRRTQSLECVADGELLSITYENVMELIFQNPDFGFHFLQLTTSRLFQNLDVMQAELEALRKAAGT